MSSFTIYRSYRSTDEIARGVAGGVASEQAAGTRASARPAREPVSCKPIMALFACVLGVCLAFGTALPAQAIVWYLPGVSEEMTSPSYWVAKQSNADEVLATRAQIDKINQDGIDGDGTGLQPLKIASGTYYDSDKRETLKNSAADQLQHYSDRSLGGDYWGPVYDESGTEITWDSDYTKEVLANYPTAEPTDLPSPYGIVTTHSVMRLYPTFNTLRYEAGDMDDDNLYLSMLRVNEPVLVRAVSTDGKFYFCISSCLNAAWVSAEDIALCSGATEEEAHEQWLEAWDIDASHELVVYDYKVRTEQSRQTPNTANRMLYMGTVLERIDTDTAYELVGSRGVYNNHVCYLPVRNSDGTYSKEPALIAESAKVSEGFLPLTTANIAKVAFNSLGQAYGWGGMLEANDCSGYVRDVYKCFGLELPRNTTWQMNNPVLKYDLSALDDAHKAAAIAQMPLGTVLFFSGHEMMYLGKVGDELYVISALGSIGSQSASSGIDNVRSVAINTLDMVRGNRTTWLANLDTANIPYISSSEPATSLYDVNFYANSIVWPDGMILATGSPIVPDVSIPGLVAGTDYEVTFENNVEVGKATVTITGKGDYTGEVSSTFEIVDDMEKAQAWADAKAVGAAEYAISKLPAVDEITADNAYAIAAVEDAVSVYESLTDEQKAKVDADALTELVAAQAQVVKVKEQIAAAAQEAAASENAAKEQARQEAEEAQAKADQLAKDLEAAKAAAAAAQEAASSAQDEAAAAKAAASFELAKVKLTKKTKSTKKGKVTVAWKKVDGATGYEVKVGNTIYTVNKASKLKKTVKVAKNKRGKKVKVRVRAFKKQGSNTLHSSWSKVKKVKVKK